MTDDFANVYDDARRADAYARLEFPGTYHLAFRDLPALFAEHVRGPRALDFGCGTGRSTRFLAAHGCDPVTGVDIAAPMLERARAADPRSEYVHVGDGDLSALGERAFDLVLAAFTFDNVPTAERKALLLRALRERLAPDGRLVTIVSTPEIYVHEWASFSTRDFPDNRDAGDGDPVRIVMLDVDDRRPVEDVLTTPERWARLHADAGLRTLAVEHPLGRDDEPFAWVSETRVAPWAIHVLGRAD